jgi:hypothetical protein
VKKIFKIGLILFGIGLLAGFGTYMYVFHKPHRNILKETPAYTLAASDLYTEFSLNETASFEKYANKVLQINGEVADIQINDNNALLTLNDAMEGVNCSFDSVTVAKNLDKLKNIHVGDKIELKGQCDGYDIIMGVVFTSCVLL